jgi:hypothetical protein
MKLTKLIIDASNGTEEIVELTSAEIAEITAAEEANSIAKDVAEQLAKEKAAAKNALLDRLGMTAEEAALLLQ